MSEPKPLAIEKEGAGASSLWADAPAWRNLTVGATLLTAAAVLCLSTLIPPQSSAPASAPPRLSDQQKHVMAGGPSPSPTSATIEQKPIADTPSPPPAAVPAGARNEALPSASIEQAAPAYVHAPMSAESVSAEAMANHEQALAKPEPQAAPAAQQMVCLLVAPPAPTRFSRGTVMAFEDKATSAVRTKHNEAELGGQIDPDFIDNQRVNVKLNNGSYRIFIVPKTMVVRLGDAVSVQSLYKNVNRSCEYIPPLITADLGPTSDKDAAPTQPIDH